MTFFSNWPVYDEALVKSAAPHAIRLAFHLNMDESNGCLDQTAKFSNGLQQFTNKIDANYELFTLMYDLIQQVNVLEENTAGWDGTSWSKVSEAVCPRKEQAGNCLLYTSPSPRD